jgi:arginine/lysine/ornithine decarboxylase
VAQRPSDRIDEAQDAIAAAERDGRLDQRCAPIVEALAAFLASQVASYSIPAHKHGRGIDAETLAVLGREPYLLDAPMHHGLDDRTSSKQVLAHAQSLAADAFGAEQCLFSTNGSTLSVQLGLLAIAQPGEQVVIGRNAHKSMVSGIVLSGVEPVWVETEVDEERACTHTVTAEAVARAFDQNPEARGAMVVSPTTYGAVADVRGLAEVCHERGVPLVIDDAWGASFAFHPELPPSALAEGADLQIASFHKSLNAIMQTSMLAVQGDRIDRDRLQLAMDSFETTSTSVLLIASMDAARRQMAVEGERLLGETLRLARRARTEIGALPGLDVFGLDLVGRPGVAALDETKIVVDLRSFGMTGYDAADWLWAEQRIGPELADHQHLLFLVTVGDDDHSVDQLVRGVRALAEHGAGAPPIPPVATAAQLLEGAEYPMHPRQALLGAARKVPLLEAVGELAAEPVSPYPRGVPVLIPGQRVTRAIVDFLHAGVGEGMLVEGAADPSLEQLRVVDQERNPIP